MAKVNSDGKGKSDWQMAIHKKNDGRNAGKVVIALACKMTSVLRVAIKKQKVRWQTHGPIIILMANV